MAITDAKEMGLASPGNDAWVSFPIRLRFYLLDEGNRFVHAANNAASFG